MIDWLSGERGGLLGVVVRAALWLGQWPYRLVVACRNRGFDVGRSVVRVELPVVSIGNVTTGGTGKTPMVAWVCRYLRGQGVRVAILSRGYGAEGGSVNDEALELEQQLPDVPHLQDPDRVAMANVARDELASQVLVLDDGFQHRRLGRDLDWVLIDAMNPFGFGHCLPRGLLREPLSGLGRASAILLTRCDQVSSGVLDEVRLEVSKHIGVDVPVLATRHQPLCLRASSGNEEGLDSLAGARVAAFCAIGHPEAFRLTLQQLGAEVVAWRVFPDHHRFDRDDVRSLESWVRDEGEVDMVVCTAKDLVKLNLERLGGKSLWSLVIGMVFDDDPSVLHRQLAPLLERARELDAELDASDCESSVEGI